MRGRATCKTGLIPHIFLPIQLPGHCSNIVNEECELLTLFNETIQACEHGTPQEDLFKNTKTTFKTWESLQENIDPRQVSEAIQSLNDGETFGMYIRSQNAGFMVSVPPQKDPHENYSSNVAVFSTFPASQASKTVTCAIRDLAGVFPVTSVLVPKSQIINSVSFGRQVNALSFNDVFEAMPTTIKAGHEIAEIRDVADPMFVSKWLTATLCNEHSKSSSTEFIPRVIKKVRDSVVFHEALVPFRRSGLWMTAKVILEICLIRDLGINNGIFLYKLIMIKFMLLFVNHEADSITPGLRVEMMGKIARRSRKLQLFKEALTMQSKPDNILLEGWLERLYNFLMEESASILKTVHNSLKLDWEGHIKKESEDSEFYIKDLNMQVHHSLKMGNINDIIKSLQNSQRYFSLVKMVTPIPSAAPRHRDFEVKFDIVNFYTLDEHFGIVLYDFERNVRLWDNLITRYDAHYVWKIFQLYIDKSRQFYHDDPVGLSRMILTALKIIQVWDKITCDDYEMLREHRPGIDMSFAEDLVLPNRVDLLLLFQLQNYFKQRENRAIFPSMVEEREVSASSFSARFPKTNEDMQIVRSHILKYTAGREKEKLLELGIAKEKCEKLLSRIKCLECEYIIDHWKRKHSHKCEKCLLAEQERKMAVTVFEAPLPPGEDEQNAVIFELRIPSQVAVLRDLTFLFGFRVITNIPEMTPELHGPWSNYNQIASCSIREEKWIVDLMSTKKLVMHSHYKDLHPSNPASDFIRKNGYNCHFSAHDTILGTKYNRTAIKNICTLRVEKKSPYSTMQWAVDGNKMTANEVLARQCECHNDLSLLEFVEFGSLRTGWRIQWRNIYRALTQQTLSLKNESVFNLLCQTVWQVGPPDHKTWIPKAHQDFQDINFAKEFLKLLYDTQKQHSENWKDHYVLLTVIIFSQRILSITQYHEIINSANEILANCRLVAANWSNEIQRIVSQMTNAPRAEVDALRIKMIEVNVCRALTFRIDFMDQNSNTMGHIMIKNWLLTIAKIHDNLVLIGKESKIPLNLRNLLRRVEEVGVFLEPYLQDAISTGHLSLGLNLFVQEHYSGCKIVDYTTYWLPYDDNTHSQIYFCELIPKENEICEKTTLQMDIIKGRFLVDGCPVGYLASSIETHLDFCRAFPTKSFEVQPYAFQPGRMMTRDKYLGSTYSFYMKNDDSLLITEHLENNTERELISHTCFKNNVPPLLVKDFTHWWNKNEKRFEFFFRDPDYPSKLSTTNPAYILGVKDYLLRDYKIQDRFMVDVTCNGYKRIVNVMERLENWKYVNIWYLKSTNQYYVELPRMGLQFTFTNPKGLISLTSKEYRGMKVSKVQNIKTLIGLHSGLLIEDADVGMAAKKNSILLMPHGTLVKDLTNRRILVNSEAEPHRNPLFFAYEVDSQLKQLKAGETQAGWVYLAHLHAITASPLPDPFTGITGTERALQILQSGISWTCQPMDEETVLTLQYIAALSPDRHYYPRTLKKMESVWWPHDAQVAHDAYQLIVEKLFSESDRLKFLFQKDEELDQNQIIKEEEEIALKSDRELCIRGYWRRFGLSTELARISPAFHEEFIDPPDCQPIQYFDVNFKSDHMKSVLQISQMCHSWVCNPPSPSTALVKKLIFTGKDLKGVYDEGYPIKEAINSWAKTNIRDFWLDLYMLARKVTRKKLQPEWSYLMTFFAFRDDASIYYQHLMLLHTIAVYPEEFQTLDPPEYTEYYQTDEFKFDYDTILEILRKECATTWQSYMDRHADEMRIEDSLESFVGRLQPIHEELVESQSTAIANKILHRWPIDSCDDIFEELKDDEKSEINCMIALNQLNIILKNWYRNQCLMRFIGAVEETVATLTLRNKSKRVYVDVSKTLVKFHQKSHLENLCKTLPFTIDLKSLLENRGETYIDEKLFEQARSLFNFNKSSDHSQSNHRRSSKGNEIKTPEFPLKLEDSCPILQEYMCDLKNSWTQFHENSNPSKKAVSYYDVQSHLLTREYKETKASTMFFWEKIKWAIQPRDVHLKDPVTKQLVFSEIFPRVVPLSLLPLIKEKKPTQVFLEYLWNLMGAYGVLLTLEQKAARCVRYSQKGKNFQGFELQKELSHVGHENWNPAERPDWLLFEIEMDLMVRPIQAKVAERMENPGDNDNALIQLNMGEGKTSVIVPLLVLSLADGKQLCRVTVLKSLYRINHTALITRIGGILVNRRVYTFPCRRDKKIDCHDAERILDVYKECVERRGVVMTLPEYRLSFELKAYEKCQANSFIDGKALFMVQNWLKLNSRDVLDESDEILHVKYQLIYTLGKQMTIEGGSLRWTVLQGLLSLIPNQMQHLLKRYGPNYIEFKERDYSFEFPNCRILKSDCNQELCSRLAVEILNGHSKIQIPEIPSSRKAIMHDFLTIEQIDRQTFNDIFKWYPIHTHQEVLLILRGFLACGVLCTALSKRWRVNYGVNPVGYRRMAVPFRAKDVAAERTEFGHPDVAIVLTELSYYYSGLNDDQIAHCFVILFLTPNPSEEYKRWISLVPTTFTGYDSIRHLSGVNLKDFSQRTKILFPALKNNVATIDFWLSNVVFPQESKQFGFKIGSSPWDLCLDRKNRTHPTTGFSGTNDSKLLLPKTISQKDLPELQGTNGEVLRNLLLKENNSYESLPLGFTGRQILDKLVDDRITLLLDVGALMLELDNEQVAKQWLKRYDYVDAAVYFDENNKLVVIDRSGNPPVSLETSTFRTRLDRCVIYLDDVHTRGTDLKIPPDTRGCVTLGKGVTKDKLVQGCMRMRMLGETPGHRVVFWASQEVHNVIQTLVKGAPIETEHVLLWSIINNRDAIKEGFIHWATAGVYQAQKLSAHVLFNSSSGKDSDWLTLAESCAQKEQVDLKAMYGDVRSLERFPTIVQHLLNRVNRELGKRLHRSSRTEIKDDIRRIVEFFGSSVREHSEKYVSELMRSTQLLDEEQERELEHELEAQHQKQKPCKAKSHEHSTSLGVTRFIESGHLQDINVWAVQIPLALQSTPLWNLCPNDTWAPTTYATKDFTTVIRSTVSRLDKADFLRAPNWMCSVTFGEEERKRGKKTVVLLLSPWEVENFMDLFRSGAAKAVLHMFAPRLSLDQDTLFENQSLTIPSRVSLGEPLPSNIRSALLLFSGSSYFADKKEQDEYCRFAGFCPRPRTAEEEEALEQDGLVDGFVSVDYRQKLGYENCAFAKNPEKLIRKIIERRYGSFSMDCHVGKVVFQCIKPFP